MNIIDDIMYRLGWVRATEYHEMAHRFACVLDHATGGLMSKTNYTKEAMYSVIDDHITDLVNQEIQDQMEVQEIKDFDFLCDAHKEDDDAADPS